MKGIFREFLITYRPWIKAVSVLFTLAAVGVVIFVAVVGFTSYRASQEALKPVNAVGMPLQNLTAGIVQVGDCIRSGPTTCTDYVKSTKFMATMAPSLTVTAPDGTEQRVKLGADTTPEQWAMVGNRVSFSGKANPGTVTESTVKKIGDHGVTAAVPGGVGTFEYSILGNMIVLTSVSWQAT